MADEIIYNLRVSGSDSAQAALGKTEIALKKVNAQRNELIKKQQAGDKLTAMEGRKLEILTQQQARLKAEKQQYNRVLTTEQKITNKAVGEYARLNASLSKARQRYRDLAAAGKANTNEGKKLLTQIQHQDAKLKDIDGSMGQYQRNVGDYKNQIINAFGQMGLPVHRFNGLLEAQAGLQQKLTTATAGSSKAMRIFKVALISTGIGAIAVALGTLAAAFFSTQRGADAVNRVLIPLRTVLQRIWGVIQELSFAMVDAFKNPKQAIIDLWNLLKQNIVNRITGIADQFRALGGMIRAAFNLDWDGVKENAKDFAESTAQVLTGVDDLAGKVKAGFKSLGDEIKTANEEGKRLADIKVELEKLAIVSAGLEGKLRRAFEEQRVILNDVNEAEEKRLAAGEAAIKAAEEQRDLKLQELELLIEQEQIKLKQNDSDREAQLELARLQAQRDELEATHLRETLRIRNRMNAITKQTLANVEKAIESEAELFNELERATDEMLTDAVSDDIEKANESIENFLTSYVDKLAETAKRETELKNQRLKNAQQIQNEVGKYAEYLGESLRSGENALKEFGKRTISIMFDIAERILNIKLGEILVQSLAQPDSIATFGASGIARAAVITAIAKAAFAGLRSIALSKFEQGGIIGGKPHSQGGTKFVGSDGSAFEAERGEFLAIINRHDAETAAAYSAINGRHGKKFASGGMVVPGSVANAPSVDVSQIEQVVRSIVNIPVVVAESDISRAQRSVRVAETKGDF